MTLPNEPTSMATKPLRDQLNELYVFCQCLEEILFDEIVRNPGNARVATVSAGLSNIGLVLATHATLLSKSQPACDESGLCEAAARVVDEGLGKIQVTAWRAIETMRMAINTDLALLLQAVESQGFRVV